MQKVGKWASGHLDDFSNKRKAGLHMTGTCLLIDSVFRADTGVCPYRVGEGRFLRSG